jgi:hypothetical protein
VAGGGELGREVAEVVDDVVGAELAAPGRGGLARGGGDDLEADEAARELDGDRADAAGAADDEDPLAAVAAVADDAEALEQALPRGDGGQRQGGGGGEVEGPRLGPDDALVDEVVLAVAAGAGDAAGVVDLVAGAEQGDVGADGLDDAGDVPAEDPRARLDVRAAACGPWCRRG